MRSTVRSRPIWRNSASPVASNCRMAEPNWKPWVHSVQPRLVYLPPTVKTGAPLAGGRARERGGWWGGGGGGGGVGWVSPLPHFFGGGGFMGFWGGWGGN